MNLLLLPLAICLLVSGAVHVAWRRRPEARHARAWSLAFALAGVGWLATLVTTLDAGLEMTPGTAAQLGWLGAGMSFVHGLRARAGRRDRSMVLAVTWAVIAFASAILPDLAPYPALGGAGAAVLCAVGLLVGAVAIGPRARRARPIDWGGMMLLGGLALAEVLLAALLADGALTVPLAEGITLAASLAYVATGLVTMLLISGDLALALERLARTDPLTKVWNRRGFEEAGPHLLARLRGADPHGPATVAIADIDAFKSVNDRFGHAVGDAVLARFATLLGAAVGKGDLLARLGGEEFAMLAIGADAGDLFHRVEQVRHALERQTGALPGLPPVTASFGVARVQLDTLSLRDALERADRALYRAKHDGRNRTVVDEGVAALGVAAMPPGAAPPQ